MFIVKPTSILVVVVLALITTLRLSRDSNVLRSYNIIPNNETDASQTTKISKLGSTSQQIKKVDCSDVLPIEPVIIKHMVTYNGHAYPSYPVSLSWWDGRRHWHTDVPATPTVHTVQKLIMQSPQDEVYVDVGANVGYMTMFAVSQNRPVFAVEPISYNIAKLCEGYLANQNINRTTSVSNFYHAAAGAQDLESVNITRPSDKIGYFDQTSLSRDAVWQEDTVTEKIPMLTLDSIFAELEDVKIGLLKIDVQGNEEGVFGGMTHILRYNPPRYIFYESHDKLTEQSGYVPGRSQSVLEFFGYSCEKVGDDDTLCMYPK